MEFFEFYTQSTVPGAAEPRPIAHESPGGLHAFASPPRTRRHPVCASSAASSSLLSRTSSKALTAASKAIVSRSQRDMVVCACHIIGTEVRMFANAIRASLLMLGIVAITSTPAAAFKKVNIGTRTKDYMQDLCGKVGGQYLEGQGQYGCMTNCGGTRKASDACGINCSEKTNECYGWSPARKISHSPKAILQPPLTLKFHVR